VSLVLEVFPGSARLFVEKLRFSVSGPLSSEGLRRRSPVFLDGYLLSIPEPKNLAINAQMGYCFIYAIHKEPV
jgi:hypothetical protein